MKKIITSLSSLLLLAGSFLPFFMKDNIDNFKETKADEDSVTVYLNPTQEWDKDGAWFNVYEFYKEIIVDANDAKDFVYYITDIRSSDGVWLHAWGGTATDWHGKQMSYEGTTLDGHYIYKGERNKNTNFIFNNSGGSKQTSNIENQTEPFIYVNKTNDVTKKPEKLTDSYKETVVVGNTKMTKVGEDGSDKDFYEATVGKNHTYIFTRMNPSYSTFDWNGVWGQTYDLDGIPDGTNCYRIDKWEYDKNYSGSWHLYTHGATKKHYIRGDFCSIPWSLDNAIEMELFQTGEYKAIVPFSPNSEFRVFNDATFDGGYVNTKLKSDANSHFTQDDVGANIIADGTLAEGAYEVYYKYEGDNLGLYISHDVVPDSASSLSTFIMQSDTQGQCITKFYKVRTRYLNMTDENKDAFKNKSAAWERYTAWAKALGEDPESTSKLTKLSMFGPLMDINDGSSTNPILIVLIASLVTGLTIGGYFLLRKRKED